MSDDGRRGEHLKRSAVSLVPNLHQAFIELRIYQEKKRTTRRLDLRFPEPAGATGAT
jgi:hypothetical protein